MASVYKQADDLMEADKFPECYNLIHDLAEKQGDPEACWRVAQCKYAKLFYGHMKLPEAEYKKLVEEGKEICEKGLAKDPNNARCLTWLGIFINLMASMISTDEQIKNSYKIKDLWDKSLKIEPDYYVTHHCLGQWCYTVADLPSVKRVFASTFMTSPPKSSYDESLKYAEQCNKLKPGFLVTNLSNLAKCHKKLGNKEKAQEYAVKVMQHPRDCVEKLDAMEEVKGILKK